MGVSTRTGSPFLSFGLNNMSIPFLAACLLGRGQENCIKLIQVRVRCTQAVPTSAIVAGFGPCSLPGFAACPLGIVDQSHTIFAAEQCCRYGAGYLLPILFGPFAPDIHELALPAGVCT